MENITTKLMPEITVPYDQVLDQQWYLTPRNSEGLYKLGEKLKLKNGEIWGHVTVLSQDSLDALIELLDKGNNNGPISRSIAK